MKPLFLIISFILTTLISFYYFHSLKQPARTPSSRFQSLLNPTTPTPLPATPTPTPTPTPRPNLIKHEVPFISQAPSGQWSNPIFQDGCEETSLLMASLWVNQKTTPLTIPEAEAQITRIAQFVRESFGTAVDSSAADTRTIATDYFDIQDIQLISNPTANELIDALYDNHLIITPMNGRLLGNPNFTPPGPERHMLVIIGYNATTQQFITNDPGTRLGKDYHYPVDRFMAAIADYPTGNHVPTTNRAKTALIISQAPLE